MTALNFNPISKLQNRVIILLITKNKYVIVNQIGDDKKTNFVFVCFFHKF